MAYFLQENKQKERELDPIQLREQELREKKVLRPEALCVPSITKARMRSDEVQKGDWQCHV
jgi:hypothetical protein